MTYQVPHHAFPWLMLTAFWSLLPVMWRGPWWFALAVLPLFWWRWKVQQQRWVMPGKIVRSVLMLVGVAAVAAHYRTLLGQEAGVALLSLAFTLKLLEMFRRRDAYVVLVLANFVLASACLFDRSPGTAIYVFLGMVTVLAALISINLDASHLSSISFPRQASKMVLQALPIMILLFVLVPRFAPLWHMPADKNRAKTGMSDVISPGDVSELSQSSALAFRVEFEGAVPPPAERYWRGLTYSWFDGRRWSQAQPARGDQGEYVSFYRNPQPWAKVQAEVLQEPRHRYRVILEATGQQWLYALTVPHLLQSNRDDIALVTDYRLVTRQPIETAVSYEVLSGTLPPNVESLTPAEYRHFLRVPGENNARTRQWASQLREQFASDEELIRYLLNWFRQNEFYYTLSPPLYSHNGIDEFLFDQRRGFCEHYASAMAVVLRAAGIPTRLVGGYQGGRMNSVGTHLMVRQYDAHAWVEAWLPGRGWIELDPTAAVAPERVELGLEAALSGVGETLFSGVERITQLAWIQTLRNWADYLDFAWSKWVLGYDQQRQLDFLKRLLGEVSVLKVVLALTLSLCLTVGSLWFYFWWQARPQPLAVHQQEFRAMKAFLRRQGVALPEQPSIRQMAQVMGARYPASQPEIERWASQFEQLLYAEADDELLSLKQQGRALRKKLRRT